MLSLLLAMTLSPSVPPRQPDAAQLQRMLERLPDSARVLYVAAHPDDENTRLISWLVQVKKLRVAYLSITRGDGGQNLIGKEQGPALGLLRTQELLAARRLDGAEQFFTRARDFGYSKNPEETLRVWGHDRILEDVVQVVRTFRPEVILTRFSPDDRDTHGHHTASAQLAVEAFSKAADPAYGSLPPWKARRVVWNAFQRDEKDPMAGFLRLDTNPYDPLLGVSMGELAGDSRTMHKSQGFGAPRGVMPVIEYFKLLAGEPMSESFLDGVPATKPPYKSLAEAYAADPRPEIAEAIAASAGLFLSAITETQTLSPGSTLSVTLAALQRVPSGMELLGAQLGASSVPGPGALTAPWIQKTQYTPQVTTSDPPWLQQPPADGYYPVENLDDRIRPEPPAPLFAEFRLRTGKQEFSVRRPVVVKWVDPVLGERTKAVEIAPPATVDAAPLLLFPDAGERPLRATVRASAGPVEGVLRISGGDGFSITPAEQPFKLESGEQTLTFTVKPGAKKEATLALELIIGGKKYDRGLRRLEYAHIPPQSWHPLSRVKAVRLDLKRGSTTSIGYVEGAGDEVPAVLAELGYQVTPLDERALRERDLGAWDAIVLGVRAFNVHPWLAALKPKLFDYVERGGVVVEQYNTKNWISKLPEPLGPWPMNISQQRVTDETAEVTLGADPVLRGPNRIGPADFEGWVQERGLYFADKWDDKYAAPLSMHDPSEPPLKGALLIARSGKGRFVYTGLAFFRQLPAGVPGAIRLFVNLLARDKDAS